MAVAAVDQSEFPPQLDILDGNQLHAAGPDVILSEAFADQRYAEIRADEEFDHGYTGQFHDDAQISHKGAENLIEHLAREARLGKNQRLAGDILGSDLFLLGER